MQIHEETFAESHAGGVLLGTHNISEAPSDLLRQCVARSYQRWELLNVRVDINTGDRSSGELRALLLTIFADREIEAVNE